MNIENFSNAKQHVDFALSLDTFDYMISLHKALKAEIEYELGNYEDCKNIIISIREDFNSDPELWNKKAGNDVVKRINWYWSQLENKTT